MENRENEGLKSLGRKTEYKSEYAPEVLETFENRHQDNDYWVRFNCPEFTSLCPITGQPDFAEIRISYINTSKLQASLHRVGAFPSIRTQTTAARVPDMKLLRKNGWLSTNSQEKQYFCLRQIQICST